MKILLKQTAQKSVQNRHTQTAIVMEKGDTTGTRNMNKVKAVKPGGISCADYFKPRRDHQRSTYLIGLTERVTNPWFEKDPTELITEYSLPSSWEGSNILERIVKDKKISLQHKLEIEARVDPDFFTEKYKPYKKGTLPDFKNFTYLQNREVKLEGNLTHSFDLSDPYQYIDYLILMSNSRVAKDKNFQNPGVHMWTIAAEFEDEVELKDKNIKLLSAMSNLNELLNKYTDKEKYMIGVQLLDRNLDPIIRGKVNTQFIDNVFIDYLNKNSGNQVVQIERFETVYSTFTSTPDLFYVNYILSQGLITQIIYESNGYIWWKSQKNTPALYKFDSINKFREFLLTEYEKFDEGDEDSPYYKYVEELKGTGVEYLKFK